MRANLFDVLAAGFPVDRTEVAFERPDGRTVSFSELEAGSARMANALLALGVARGDRVLVQTAKSPAAVMLYLACLRAGAVYLPLNTAYTEGELAYFIADAEPTVIVCDPAKEAAIRALVNGQAPSRVLTMDGAGKGTMMEAAADASDEHTPSSVDLGDLAAILYTSGTTGRSKGAMLTHGNLASNALTLHALWGFRPGDVLLHALPIFHVHGLFVALHCALLNGSRMLFLDKFDADTVVRLLPRATVMMGVPTFYTRLLGHADFTREVCANVRLFVSGSAPLLEETFNAFERRTGHRILERYGMTEAGMITSNPLDGDRIPATVGFPLPGVNARIADDAGHELSPGEIGILEIKGPNVFSGYWRMPDKTAEEFREDGYFITGDMAVMDTGGRISLVGRAKDLIISGGYNIYPKEIEGHLDEIPGISETAVIGVPHKDFGEAVVAVATRTEHSDVDEAGVIAALEGKIARFKQPKRVFFMDSLPRNTMGKVQKNILREQYKGCFGA